MGIWAGVIGGVMKNTMGLWDWADARVVDRTSTPSKHIYHNKLLASLFLPHCQQSTFSQH